MYFSTLSIYFILGGKVSNSSITKQALANAFKELMLEKSFYKITINDICLKCHLNRKSFYYHFKDKYELLNWIFYSEFFSTYKDSEKDIEKFFLELCTYLYNNRYFYRQALVIEDYNNFKNCLQKNICTLVKNGLRRYFSNNEINEFDVIFMADGFVCSIERWLMDSECISPEKFVNRIFNFIKKLSQKLNH